MVRHGDARCTRNANMIFLGIVLMSSLVRRWVRGCEHSATQWEGFVIFFADCAQTTSVAIFRAHLIKANIRLWVWPRARRRLYIKTVSVLCAAECTVASAQNKLVWLPSGFFAISHWHFVCVCVCDTFFADDIYDYLHSMRHGLPFNSSRPKFCAYIGFIRCTDDENMRCIPFSGCTRAYFKIALTPFDCR